MNKWYFACGSALLLSILTGSLQAQEESPESSGTKIIVIEEKVDQNGNKTVTKTIREGDFTDEEIESIIDKESNGIPSASGDKGYLGVMIAEADGGVRITDIVDDSPAATSGLKSGDVIVAVDNYETGNMQALVDAISSHKPGEKVSIHFLRDGTSATLPVVLGVKEDPMVPGAFKWDEDVMKKHEQEMKNHEDMMKHHSEMMEKHEQMEKEAQKPRFGVYMDDEKSGPGVLITEVVDGSIAESAGLKEGDVITKFNGNAINSPSDLIDAVQSAPSGKKVKVEYTRQGKQMSEKVTF